MKMVIINYSSNQLMNPLVIIQDLINSDSRDLDKQRELLIHFYENANQQEQEAINKIITCLCGKQLDTILYHPESIIN